MGKKLGNDYRIWIESAVAGTYNEIKGQTTTKINRSNKDVDTTSKDDFPFETSGRGFRGISIDCSILPNLPDANGYQRLETLSQGVAPVKIQIRKNGSAGVTPGDVVFEASCNAKLNDTDFGMNNAVAVGVQFTLAAAPTIDTLL